MRWRLLDVFAPILVTALPLLGVDVGAGFLLSPSSVPTGPFGIVGNDDAVSQTLTHLYLHPGAARPVIAARVLEVLPSVNSFARWAGDEARRPRT